MRCDGRSMPGFARFGFDDRAVPARSETLLGATEAQIEAQRSARSFGGRGGRQRHGATPKGARGSAVTTNPAHRPRRAKHARPASHGAGGQRPRREARGRRAT